MTIEDKIRNLAKEYANRLKSKMDQRTQEMKQDDKSHFLIYQVLGVPHDEGDLIDVYQNKGRFLYRYAGGFLEKAVQLCFKERYPDSGSIKIPNTQSKRPKTFEIDCLIGNEAIEIKWRDATTDGDHVTKEHTRIKTVAEAGYVPIRVMFYYPNRARAIRIQETLATLYAGLNGQYYFGDSAWSYVYQKTGVDLKSILEKLAKENGIKK